ncbi:ComF family protein [Pelotomaculum propionicicum]|uniref:Orotate phosphoribosyltransferase n=1 Tax=Pelotomaculum propionicicum TaxID=258475 RepID=A0A4Y7RI38_9FIRM|nr:ComF family protein [Pelotomaculum propionicicum]NLI13094.1 ComF family protein [Peptococcaceae bacterium]TEB08668.1 hypothetical protein Pmgp_03704 [Pelotomaculum propionicicum]
MKLLWKALLNLVFPEGPECPLCGGRRRGEDVCGKCRKIIDGYGKEPYCARCGRYAGKGAVFPSVAVHFCYECRKHSWPFVRARAAGPYESVLKDAIHRFKYTGRRSLAICLARLMAEAACAGPVFPHLDLALPMPLSNEKLRRRGFNQAALLAKEVGSLLQIPVSEGLLVKDFETSPQAGLPRAARESNLMGAFRVTDSGALRGRSILIIDDVFTTGSTMSSAASVVRKAGAGQVFALTAAAGRYF